jgi:hypothetical protein
MCPTVLFVVELRFPKCICIAWALKKCLLSWESPVHVPISGLKWSKGDTEGRVSILVKYAKTLF